MKSLWLAYAIQLWFVVPLLLAPGRVTMALLLVSVAVRGVVEVPLCLTKRWKVRYGMIHNVIHLALCVAIFVHLAGAVAPDPFLLLIVALTACSVVTEMVFVSWFRKATPGPESGIYFVPGGARFRKINRATGWLFLPQYATFLAVLVLNLIRFVLP